MRGQRAARNVRLMAAAWGGAVIGHALTYLIAFPRATVRDAVLASTGHSYWSAAVAAAVVLAALSVVGTFICGLRSGLGRRSEPAPEHRILATVLLLAVMQVGIYVVQEVLERAWAGAPISDLVRDHVLLIGIPLQILVAVTIALVLASFQRAGLRAGQALRREPLPRAERSLRAPVSFVRPLAASLHAARGIRAPPLLSGICRS